MCGWAGALCSKGAGTYDPRYTETRTSPVIRQRSFWLEQNQPRLFELFLIRRARMIRLRHVAAPFCVSLEMWPTFKRARLLDSPHLSLYTLPPSSSFLSLPPPPRPPLSYTSVSPSCRHPLLASPILSMSDTCIVCLGDLGESASDSLVEPVPRPDSRHASNDDKVKADGLVDEDPGQIAQLLPCGHILHNNCLKPWVERANSCPICRRSFNMVELSDRPGGMCTALLLSIFRLIILTDAVASYRVRHLIICRPGPSTGRRSRPFDGDRVCGG